MRLPDKPRLRSALRKLHTAKIDWSDRYIHRTAEQEAIDFVAAMAGIKPVYVSGRGFDHDGWCAVVLDLAAANRLHVVPGPYWQAEPAASDLPEWFTAPSRTRIEGGRAHYVARARAVAEEVKALAASGGRPTVAQEARLLGFPRCCVAAHYEEAAAFERATFDLMLRRAGGDEAEMRRRIEGGESLLPQTGEEQAQIARAVNVRPAPYTSLNMCAACAADPGSPAARLSARYREMIAALAGKRRR